MSTTRCHSPPRSRGASYCVLYGVLAACDTGAERVLYTDGHADLTLEVVAEGGRAPLAFYLTSHDATLGGKPVRGAVSLEQVAIASSARFRRPVEDGGTFDSLCIPGGQSAGWLPQGLRQATRLEAPFLGIAVVAEPGIVAGDTVTLRLVRVKPPSGGGSYALWRDGFPPAFYMSSCNGIDDRDQMEVALGHDHYNMGFSEPGRWTVTYEARARLTRGETVRAHVDVDYLIE